MLQSGKYASTKFTHRPKIRFFAPQGRLVAPIHVKFGMTKGHVGPLGYAKFHVNWFTGWERGPKNIKKIPLFGRVAPQVGTHWPVSKIFTGFHMPNYPEISLLNLTWFASQVTYGVIAKKPRVGQLRRFFFVHPVGETMRYIEKWFILFDGLDVCALSPCKVWRRSYYARRL